MISFLNCSCFITSSLFRYDLVLLCVKLLNLTFFNLLSLFSQESRELLATLSVINSNNFTYQRNSKHSEFFHNGELNKIEDENPSKNYNRTTYLVAKESTPFLPISRNKETFIVVEGSSRKKTPHTL